MWKLVFVALAVTCLVGSRVYAQGAYLGPEVGIYNAKSADDAKFMGGAALRFRLSPGLGLEGSINYREEDYAGGKVSVKSWPVMVTGLIYPLPMLYGAIGAGWYNTTFDYDKVKIGKDINSETKQEFGWHFGGGLEIPVGSNSKITGDVRYVFLNYDFKQFPGSSDLSANFYVITVGVLFGLWQFPGVACAWTSVMEYPSRAGCKALCRILAVSVSTAGATVSHLNNA